MVVFEQLLEEEYEKLLHANNKDVHTESKTTTLPISREIVAEYTSSSIKGPWFIDLLNLNLNNEDLALAKDRIIEYYTELKNSGQRITSNPDLAITLNATV